jgi:hypothetical protein
MLPSSFSRDFTPGEGTSATIFPRPFTGVKGKPTNLTLCGQFEIVQFESCWVRPK